MFFWRKILRKIKVSSRTQHMNVAQHIDDCLLDNNQHHLESILWLWFHLSVLTCDIAWVSSFLFTIFLIWRQMCAYSACANINCKFINDFNNVMKTINFFIHEILHVCAHFNNQPVSNYVNLLLSICTWVAQMQSIEQWIVNDEYIEMCHTAAHGIENGRG